ncbi:MAG TPA: hypothetical protein VFK89_05785, partial [Actinomycetota bacterium]|nr:hypothetical protein [Actinomycetota bacterium]
GMNQYVQAVNVGWAVFSKSGELEYGPADLNSLWRGFGGPCEYQNDGDPIVQYDSLAHRWVITQFALPNYRTENRGPFYECIAISTGEDATGEYYRYTFLMSKRNFPDYPHFGVWPDGYYATVHLFRGDGFAGQGVVAFDRQSMLNGSQGEMIKFQNPDFFGALPSDVVGSTPPPAGSPNYLVIHQDDDVGDPEDQIVMFQFHANWTNPGSSQITGPAVMPTDPIKTVLCNGFPCVTQPGTSTKLDPSGYGRLLYPFTYRNFGDHESLLFTLSENAGQNHVAPRWYEIRSPGNNPQIFQSGTQAPDADHRWMSSISIDGAGDIALGYSISSKTTFPSIGWAVHKPSDPAGTMGPEVVGFSGSGSQSGYDRWGDYTSMMVDPTDDCTFWYTNEYLRNTSFAGWRTRIMSFRVPGCTSAQPGPTPTPLPTATADETHDRTVSMDLDGHLFASGYVTVPDGFTRCADGVPVKIQQRYGRVWSLITVTRAVDGYYRIKLGDGTGTYRAKLSETRLINDEHQVCGAAKSAAVKHKD